MTGPVDSTTDATSHPEDRRTRGHPAHDLFISYSTRDKPVADAIVSRMEQAGIRCWIAPRDILPGKVWGAAIVDAIESSRVMVVVLSGDANHSPQVLREVNHAVANDVVVVPFRIEAVEPTGAMALFLGSGHWLDAMTPPLDAHIARLVVVGQALLDSATATPQEPRQASVTGRPAINERPATGEPPAIDRPTADRLSARATRRLRPNTITVALTATAALALLATISLGVAMLRGGSTGSDEDTIQDQNANGAPEEAAVAEQPIPTPDEEPSPSPWSGFEWRHNPTTGHYYALTAPFMTWDEMEALAVETGGHLVAINDAAEEEWINSTFGKDAHEYEGAPGPENHFLKIGLKKNLDDGKWRWTTGEPTDYLNWCPGHPREIDDYGGVVDAALAYYRWPEPPCWDAGPASDRDDYLGIIEVEQRPN